MAHIAGAIVSLEQQRGSEVVWLCGGGGGGGGGGSSERDVDGDGVGVTASALRDACASLSAALTADVGARVGDRVALLGLNTPEYLSALLAGTDAGCIAAPLNWRWSAAELASALALVAPAAVFVDGPCLALLLEAAARPECPSFAAVVLSPLGGGERPEPAIATAADARRRAETRDGAAPVSSSSSSIVAWHSTAELMERQRRSAQHGADVGGRNTMRLRRPASGAALIVFTSGTTGSPKGAVLTHASLTHQSMAKLAVVGYGPRDAYLHCAPLCHVGGLSSALAALLAGARHVFAPRFSAAVAMQLTRRHGVTALIAVPAMLEDMAAAAAAVAAAPVGPAAEEDRRRRAGEQPVVASLPSVLRLLVGGGGMRPQLGADLRRLFPNAAVSSAYGMTEATSSITFLAPALTRDGAPTTAFAGTAAAAVGAAAAAAAAAAAGPGGVCVGTPAPGVQVAILPLPVATGAEMLTLPTGGIAAAAAASLVGEVVTAGPHVMSGYWRDDEATRRALLPGGWLRTGDLGWLDARGRLWLLGRAKDTVKTGGENVHAREVELALESHPSVLAAAVVGVPDARLGELVAAAVTLRPGWLWRGEAAGVGISGSSGSGGSGSSGSSSSGAANAAVTAAALQDHCRTAAGLTPFKLPRRIVAVSELPRNSSGKVLKPALRELLVASQPRAAL